MRVHTHTPSHKWCGSFQLYKQTKSNSLIQPYTLQNIKHPNFQFLFLFLKKTQLRKRKDTFTRCHGIEPEEWKARSGTGHRAFFKPERLLDLVRCWFQRMDRERKLKKQKVETQRVGLGWRLQMIWGCD